MTEAAFAPQGCVAVSTTHPDNSRRRFHGHVASEGWLALPPGTRLGVYEVTGQIGAGGMGEVYRATDTKLKRQVAIKVLSPSFAADQDRLARFQREAEVLASLNYPHIAGISALGESAGISAHVMEFVDGEDLG